MGLRSAYFWPFFVLIRVEAVPPEACFANFRWDDCGQSPVPVLYYWKPGSRCEVGLWRGCLPNLNMFKDEYECVTTCIFTTRALPEHYHLMIENEIEDNTEFTTEVVTASDNVEVTTANIATDVDGGASSVSGATTVVSGGDTGGKDSNSTAASDNATTAAGAGGEAAATAAPAT